MTIGGLLIAVSAAIFLPELLGIHPQKPQHFSQTLRVNQHRIARSVHVKSNSIQDLMGTTVQTAAKNEKFNSSKTDSETAANENPTTISPEVAQVSLRARQATSSITASTKLQPISESKPIVPEFAVLSWDDVEKSEIQDHLKQISNDTIQLLSLLSTEDFPRSNFELRSFQNALNPLLTPKKREKGASLIQVLEFLDYRDSMVTAALLQERAPRKTKLAWKAISLEHLLNDSLSQQRKAEINTSFRPDFHLTEARLRYDWTNKKENRLLTPVRALVSGHLATNDVASIEWYYSDNPTRRARARIFGKNKDTFVIPRSSDIRNATLVIIAIADDGSEYAKAYNFRKNLDQLTLRRVDRFFERQSLIGKSDKRVEEFFLAAQGIRENRSHQKQQLAWRSDQSKAGNPLMTF